MKHVLEFIHKNLLKDMSELDLSELAKCVEADLDQALSVYSVFDKKRRKEIASDIAELIIKKCRDRETGTVNLFKLVLLIFHVPQLIAYIVQGHTSLARTYNRYLATAFNIPYIVDELEKIIHER